MQVFAVGIRRNGLYALCLQHLGTLVSPTLVWHWEALASVICLALHRPPTPISYSPKHKVGTRFPHQWLPSKEQVQYQHWASLFTWPYLSPGWTSNSRIVTGTSDTKCQSLHFPLFSLNIKVFHFLLSYDIQQRALCISFYTDWSSFHTNKVQCRIDFPEQTTWCSIPWEELNYLFFLTVIKNTMAKVIHRSKGLFWLLISEGWELITVGKLGIG